MPPEKIDSLADDVKPLVLGLLRQISRLTARVDELLAQNQTLLARIAVLGLKLSDAGQQLVDPRRQPSARLVRSF